MLYILFDVHVTHDNNYNEHVAFVQGVQCFIYCSMYTLHTIITIMNMSHLCRVSSALYIVQCTRYTR